MPPLCVMIKPVSSSCVLACRYCFYADVSAQRKTECFGKMSSDTMRAVVRRAFIYADESISFSFQGGEPTLAGIEFFRDFVKLVGEYNTRRLAVSFSLQTCAVTLDDEFCEFFAKHDFLIGVSLDGTEKIHNSLRVYKNGGGSFNDTRRGIKLLQKHGVQFNILCVVTKQIAASASDVWNTLSQYGHIQFIPCIDNFDGAKGEYSIAADEYGRFLIECYDLYERDALAGRAVSERRFDNYLCILTGRPPEHCGMAGVCGRYFLIEADGGVYPCDFYVLDEMRLGNINETSFARLEKSAAAEKFYAESKIIPSACRACEHFSLCRGGCRRDKEPFADGIPSENRFCDAYKMFFGERKEKLERFARTLQNY